MFSIRSDCADAGTWTVELDRGGGKKLTWSGLKTGTTDHVFFEQPPFRFTPETVGGLVALVRPEVVDVSSGVESLPGLKDHDKIARFLEAVLGRSPTVG